MTKYMKNDRNWFQGTDEGFDVHSQLPPGIYVLKFDSFKQQFYFTQVDDFDLPKKIYGKTQDQASRIIQTFTERTGKTTGVLLSGEKGSGKTLQAKTISIRMKELGHPTILINSEFVGDSFAQVIQNIKQPCVIFFDEFEKIYTRESQDEILSILDGVYTTQKLFLFTCNEKWHINQHMLNRPSRIYYHIKYAGLEEDFVIEYCNDNLKNINYLKTIRAISQAINNFNFDMLQILVEESNRYNEDPSSFLDLINVDFERVNGRSTYEAELFIKAKPILISQKKYTWNPFKNDGDRLHVYYGNGKNERVVSFGYEDLKTIKDGICIYEIPDEHAVIKLSKVISYEYDLSKLL